MRLALIDRIKVSRVPSEVHSLVLTAIVSIARRKRGPGKKVWRAVFARSPTRFLGVRIKAGPFAGLDGIVIWRKGSIRVVPSIDVVQRSVLVDIDAGSPEAVQFAP